MKSMSLLAVSRSVAAFMLLCQGVKAVDDRKIWIERLKKNKTDKDNKRKTSNMTMTKDKRINSYISKKILSSYTPAKSMDIAW